MQLILQYCLNLAILTHLLFVFTYEFFIYFRKYEVKKVTKKLIILVIVTMLVPNFLLTLNDRSYIQKAVMAKTYYVSTKGNNKNSGTIEQPFQTIQHIAKIVQPGDTVYIRGGVYREKVNLANSGTADASITFTAYKDEKVLISNTKLITPGENGVGQWQPHKLPNGKSIYKIQLPSEWDRGAGNNQIFVNGQAMIEARWPNVPDSIKLDRDDYAISTGGSLGAKRSNGLYNATYQHSGIENFWKGGYIGFNPGMEWIGRSSKVLGASDGKVNFEIKVWSNHSSGDAGPYTPREDDPFYLWGKLEALDTQKEWFLDGDGKYGSANTLYLWAPDGNPGDQTVEIKAKPEVMFDLADQSYIHLKNLNFFAGKVRSYGKSKGVMVDKVTSEYGLHSLTGGGGAAIELSGSNHQVLNSEVFNTSAKGIQLEGDNHLIKNNVVHDVGYSIAAIGDGIKVIDGTGTDVLNNTVYNTGQRGISFAGLKAGEINYNHVFEASKQRLDVAGIESFRGGDGKGTEVSYNWIHNVDPYYDPESGHLGGQGIRLDPGGEQEGISNYKIHHNLVWDTSHQQSIEVWSLNPNMENYGNSGIAIYNNTIDRGIRLFGNKGSSHQGTTVTNNIALGGVRIGGASNRDGTIKNNLDSQDNPQLVDLSKDDFRLKPSSPAINAADFIAGVKYNVPDGKPDIGALEYKQAPFVSGAVIQDEHLNNLELTITSSKQSGLIEVKVNNLPAHRKLPANFKLKIGEKTIGQEALENFSYGTKNATLYYRDSAFTGLSSTQPVKVQIGNGSLVTVDVEQFNLGNNVTSEIIGELGRISGFDHESQTIVLEHSYTNPVVFAQPLSRNGADPAIVRLTDIQSDRFSVYLQEPNYRDGKHIRESFSYFVVEAGNWQLEDGTRLDVSTLNTSAMTTSGWETVNFDAKFDKSPIMLSQVQTRNGGDFVRTRQKNASVSGFQLAMEEEEALKDSGHKAEKIGWLAISPGQGSSEGFTYQASSTADQVTNNWHSLNFSQSFQQTPHLLGSIATYDGPDSAGLRYQNLTNKGVQMMVEEDTSLDSETNHTTEVVNFLAIAGKELKAVAYDAVTGNAQSAAAPIAGEPDSFIDDTVFSASDEGKQQTLKVEATTIPQETLVDIDGVNYGLAASNFHKTTNLDNFSGVDEASSLNSDSGAYSFV